MNTEQRAREAMSLDHETPEHGLHKLLGTRRAHLSELDVARIERAIRALSPPASAAVVSEEVRKLIGWWRTRADRKDACGLKAEAERDRVCADELEAAMLQAANPEKESDRG